MLALAEKGFRIAETGLSFARGSPSLVNGVGLRLPSLRGSWVRIPPPAPKVHEMTPTGCNPNLEFGAKPPHMTSKGAGMRTIGSVSINPRVRAKVPY